LFALSVTLCLCLKTVAVTLATPIYELSTGISFLIIIPAGKIAHTGARILHLQTTVTFPLDLPLWTVFMTFFSALEVVFIATATSIYKHLASSFKLVKEIALLCCFTWTWFSWQSTNVDRRVSIAGLSTLDLCLKLIFIAITTTKDKSLAVAI
jgi:hypothetical protein